jgi:hypothetical protein
MNTRLVFSTGALQAPHPHCGPTEESLEEEHGGHY